MKLLALGSLLLLAISDDSQLLRERLLREERALLEVRREAGTMADALQSLAQDKAAARERLDKLAAARVTLETERVLLLEREEELAASWKRQRTLAAERLIMLARNSEAGALELLLTSGGPAEFVYRFHALQAMARHDRELFADLRDLRLELMETHDRYEAQGLLLDDLERKVQEDVQRLSVLEELRLEQSQRLNSEVKEREAWVGSLREAAAELGIFLRDLPVGQKKGKGGKFRSPVNGRIIARFGAPDPLAGNLLPSEGWRFSTAMGEPVKAAGDGIISYADWFQGFGNLVIIDHGGEMSTLYGHLDLLEVEAGDEISAGAIIGAAGTSGTLHEPGVYFQVRRKGAPVDPAGWLASDSR